MADVTLSYKGSDILEMSDSGSATLKTGGKYCEDDVTLEYVKPSGGGNDTSPYELYKTSFVPVSDSASVTFSLPPLSEKDITFVFGVVDNPASYLSESNINKITGFTRTHFYTGMVGGVADGVYFGNDVRAISAIDTASSADYWQSGVTMTINKEAQTYTISNTKGKTFIAGANYTVWAVFKDRQG